MDKPIDKHHQMKAIPTYRINRYLKMNAIIEEHVNINNEDMRNYFTFLDITFPDGSQTRRTVYIPNATDVENAYLKAQKYMDIEKEKLQKEFEKPNILGADGGAINSG